MARHEGRKEFRREKEENIISSMFLSTRGEGRPEKMRKKREIPKRESDSSRARGKKNL